MSVCSALVIKPSSMSNSPMPSSRNISMANIYLLLLFFVEKKVYSRVKVDFLSSLISLMFPSMMIIW